MCEFASRGNETPSFQTCVSTHYCVITRIGALLAERNRTRLEDRAAGRGWLRFCHTATEVAIPWCQVQQPVMSSRRRTQETELGESPIRRPTRRFSRRRRVMAVVLHRASCWWRQPPITKATEDVQE
jgi:hypothetical protein